MEKLLLRPVEAAEILGLGRSKTYELIASGEIPSITIGKSRRVPLAGLRAWLEAKTSGSSDGVGRLPGEHQERGAAR